MSSIRNVTFEFTSPPSSPTNVPGKKRRSPPALVKHNEYQKKHKNMTSDEEQQKNYHGNSIYEKAQNTYDNNLTYREKNELESFLHNSYNDLYKKRDELSNRKKELREKEEKMDHMIDELTKCCEKIIALENSFRANGIRRIPEELEKKIEECKKI